VPTSLHPNFRDHGRMVDGPLLRVVTSLQRKYGQCWASEAGLRQMICQDTGHMPGVDTVRRALDRLEHQGLLVQQQLVPGGIKPDGSPCTYGTRLVWIPQCRRHRRALAKRAPRERVNNRANPRAVRSLEQAVKAIGAKVERPTTTADFDERRAHAIRAAHELAARWAPTGRGAMSAPCEGSDDDEPGEDWDSLHRSRAQPARGSRPRREALLLVLQRRARPGDVARSAPVLGLGRWG
jgi:hypothetical protein